MNEQINQLYQQALEFAYKNVNKEIWNTDNFHAIVAGKFAELIVRECLYQVADVRIENNFEPVGDAALVQALAGIKKYFGVEE